MRATRQMKKEEPVLVTPAREVPISKSIRKNSSLEEEDDKDSSNRNAIVSPTKNSPKATPKNNSRAAAAAEEDENDDEDSTKINLKKINSPKASPKASPKTPKSRKNIIASSIITPAIEYKNEYVQEQKGKSSKSSSSSSAKSPKKTKSPFGRKAILNLDIEVEEEIITPKAPLEVSPLVDLVYRLEFIALYEYFIHYSCYFGLFSIIMFSFAMTNIINNILIYCITAKSSRVQEH